MTVVKICGLQRVDDALTAARAGADFIGLIFAPSRRRIEPPVAAQLVAAVRAESSVRAVGVFVDSTPDEMNRVARTVGLDYLQLSGDEGDDIVPALDLPAIQVFHVQPGEAPDDLCRRAMGNRAELVLLDTARPGTRGGTGQTFDWQQATALCSERPVLLAGGLHAANVAAAISTARPWGVDVSSGVETEGVKDPTKIKAFIDRVHSLQDG